MNQKHSYKPDYQIGIGVMTGTSLDGVDLCLCRFGEKSFDILAFECSAFPKVLHEKLSQASRLSALEFFELENEYSLFLAREIKRFDEFYENRAKFVGIHGQTIFHNPNFGLTTQMLNGAIVAAHANLITVCDFRRNDLALGGQGAPLVPIGDSDLFSEYSACLNLGGFANISRDQNSTRIAFDICPVNFVLNHFSKKLSKSFDDGGKMAKSGRLVTPSLDELNALDFYQYSPPKSLGREWIEEFIFPILESLNPFDALRTFTEHASIQIANSLPNKGHTLVTGGGTYNTFLISLITEKVGSENLIVPENKLIEGKEALIFAYLAKLRLESKINVLRSVTGASKDSCSGAVYFP
ncbi:MAG: anhydro-N-acetylmuramic acid kinase [Flavobacteriales bacterium]|nr:anhydro-N-acetylmuramic acid kinase [Flavobacteriales bacterium]